MNKYHPTIGLEIHAELKTRTKMFCGCKNDPDEKAPNANICPICLAHPGTLPTINGEAVKQVLRVGLAVHGTLADDSQFDRKNYFYPDIPKGYQISQYKYPLVSGGMLNGVRITRVHLEEDTARSIHQDDQSLIDFNRAGVPLMELVTEPDLHDAKQAADFARELQLLLWYLDASEANLEKGEMRVEANVSVQLTTERTDLKSPKRSVLGLGTKVEIKNLNSFRAVERAIEFEIKRQSALLEKGEPVVQETRGWDENKAITFSQRVKESAHDYRYFPDPDLPKLRISQITDFKNLKKTLPELPWQKRERYQKLGLPAEDAEVLINQKELADLFENTIKESDSLISVAANYLINDLVKIAKDHPETIANVRVGFAELIKMIVGEEISSRGAKDILLALAQNGGAPRELAQSLGLFQTSDAGELTTVVAEIITAWPNVVVDYKNGKESALQFLIGQGMKATKGAANPEVLKKILEDLL